MIRVLFVLIFIIFHQSLNAKNDDWPSYGKDSGGGHYSEAPILASYYTTPA